MLARTCFVALSILSVRAWSQAGIGGMQDQMQTPSIASGEVFSTDTLSEQRSNYVTGGLNFSTSYDNNVLGAGASKPVSDFLFIVQPVISVNTSTTRQKFTLTGSPGFTFYQPTSELSQSNLSVSANYQYRMSPHSTVVGRESFTRMSGSFGLPNQLIGATISGSPVASPTASPYMQQMSNTTSGGASYQFSPNGMIGAFGGYNRFSLPGQSEASGLSNSSSEGLSTFFSTRFSKSHNVGFNYAFSRSLSAPLVGTSSASSIGTAEVLTHSFSGFYSFILNANLSATLSAGPQFMVVSQAGSSAKVNSWGPSVAGTFGWQATRIGLAFGAEHGVFGGAGVFGVFKTTGANAAVHYEISRLSTISVSESYQIQREATTELLGGSAGGHTLQSGVQIGRSIGERSRVGFGWDRIHQSYAGISSIGPNDDHVFISISYMLTRPLGR